MGLTLSLMLIGTAILQTHLKFKPQLMMLGLGTTTIIGYIVNLKRTTTFLFGLLLSLLLYTNFFSLYIWFLQVTGRSAPLMEIGAMITAIILTALTLILYFWKFKREPKMERACAVGYLILTAIVFMIYEIQVFR